MYINNIITILTVGVVLMLVTVHIIDTHYKDKKQDEANEYVKNGKLVGKTYHIRDKKLNEYITRIYESGNDNPLVSIMDYYKADIGLYNSQTSKVIIDPTDTYDRYMWLAMDSHTGSPVGIFGVPVGKTVKHVFEKPVQNISITYKPI